MGVVQNVGFSKWPRQGSFLGSRVTVCFEYDTSNSIGGEIVRDDAEQPGRTIIRLDDGRYVLAVECMYSVEPEGGDA